MSAALHLVDQPLETYAGEKSPEKTGPAVAQVMALDQSPEFRLRRALDEIKRLQDELKTLRDELSRAERSVEHRETLLRNAMVREQELRAELVRSLF
ncbi:MAG: hypothetical protein ACKV2V_10655 [Blastocatellia bacterium]